MNADEMAGLIVATINKSGGIEKWRRLREKLQEVKANGAADPDAFQKFVRHVSRDYAGSRQFIALALLGLTCGEIVHDGMKAREAKN